MSLDDWTKNGWLRDIVLPLLIPIAVGFGSSWMSTQVALERYGAKIKSMRSELQQLNKRVKKNEQKIQESKQEIYDSFERRLTQIETKMDLLIDDRIKQPEEDE